MVLSMGSQSTSQFSEHFIKQIDSQLDGDFISLSNMYQHVTGHEFNVKYNNNALFSMLQQALMTEDKCLLKLTMEFIETLPAKLQSEFQAFSQRSHRASAAANAQSLQVTSKTEDSVVNKLCRLLHLKSVA